MATNSPKHLAIIMPHAGSNFYSGLLDEFYCSSLLYKLSSIRSRVVGLNVNSMEYAKEVSKTN